MHLALALCVAIGLGPGLVGQTSDSILVGVVTDISGAAVASAAISATNTQTGVKYSSVAGTSGEYRLNNIPVGQYDVTASAAGFVQSVKKNVDLQLNHTATVNLTLSVASVSTTVEVADAGAGYIHRSAPNNV
jgi:hypothetical protein